MDKWLLELATRLPKALAVYAISAAVFVGLARLCLPLLFAVLDKELPGSRVTEFLALLLAWGPAVFVAGFLVIILAYLLWISTGARH